MDTQASTPPEQDQQNAKDQRRQLPNSMEHMRFAVTVPEDPSSYGVPGYIQPVRKPRTDSSANIEKRSDPFQFGSRYLEEGDDIFDHNAWDHVDTDETYKDFAETQYARQRESPVTEFDKKRFNDYPERWWNKFYANNTANFFKNRKWLHQEFPILSSITTEDAPETLLLEVGAGAGNTAFPIMALNKNPRLKLHACDFSKKAVEIIKSNEAYASPDTIGRIEASVWDVASAPDSETQRPTLPDGLEANSVDIVILIFIFSALAPSQWNQAMWNIWHVLKPGGVLLFRDYGRGDLAQVRFKKGRWMEENFYVRGDGTRVYFFDDDELKELWTGAGAATTTTTTTTKDPEELEAGMKSLGLDASSPRPKFDLLDFGIDRRMLVNRRRRLKMYRCWMQARFRKPLRGD